MSGSSHRRGGGRRFYSVAAVLSKACQRRQHTCPCVRAVVLAVVVTPPVGQGLSEADRKQPPKLVELFGDPNVASEDDRVVTPMIMIVIAIAATRLDAMQSDFDEHERHRAGQGGPAQGVARRRAPKVDRPTTTKLSRLRQWGGAAEHACLPTIDMLFRPPFFRSRDTAQNMTLLT